MGLIAVSEETKQDLDNLAAKLAVARGVKSVTYEGVIREILDCYCKEVKS
jgi:hypothetical protein